MAGTLAIICEVHQLAEPVSDDGKPVDGPRQFAVHFYPTLATSAAPDGKWPCAESYLLPWAWGWTKLSFGAFDPKKKAVHEIRGDEIKIERDLTQSDRVQRLEADLRAHLLDKGVKAAFWDEPSSKTNPRAARSPDDDWKSLLAHTSLLPAPLPHRLGLALVITVPRKLLNTGETLLLAPVFDRIKDDAPFPKGRAPRAASTVSWVDIPGVDDVPPIRLYHWDYAPGSPASNEPGDVRCWQSGCPVDAEPLRDWLDTHVLDDDDDWLADFEERLAGALDFPRVLAGSLRANLAALDENVKRLGEWKGGPLPKLEPYVVWQTKDWQHWLERAVGAAHWETAGVGEQVGPSGKSYVDQVLRQLPDVDVDALKTLIAGNVKVLLDKDADGWWKHLSNSCPPGEPPKLWSLPVPDKWTPTDAQEWVTDFQGLRATLLAQIDWATRQSEQRARDPVLAAELIALWSVNGSKDFREKLTAALVPRENEKRVVQVRRGLRLAALGRHWGDIRTRLSKLTATADARAGISVHDSLRTQAIELVTGIWSAAFASRLSLNKSGAVPSPGKRGAAPSPDIANLIPVPSSPDLPHVAWFRSAVTAVLGTTEQTPSRRDPVDALTVLMRDPKQPGLAEPKGATGVVLFLRQDVDGKPWRCLNLALVDQETVVVASKPMRRNGVPQGYLSYRNDPLSAISPATGLTLARLGPPRAATSPPAPPKPSASLAPRDSADLLPVYDNPYRPDLKQKLERLVYGRNYWVAAARVGHAGALPKIIADENQPWKLPPLIPPTLPIPNARPYQHLRRVPVGALRLGWLGKGDRAPQLVPDDVYPIAETLRHSNAPPSSGKPPVRLAEAAGYWRGKPLVVLASWHKEWSERTLKVRPPAADLRVWDAWRVDGRKVVKAPADIWAEVAWRLGGKPPLPGNDPPDPTLDDPAVSRFELSLACWYRVSANGNQEPPPGSPPPPPVDKKPFDIKFTPGADDLLLPFQGFRDFKLRAEEGPDDGKIDSDGTVTLRPGRIYELTIAPKFDQPERFSETLRQELETAAATSIVIEVAAPLPVDAPQELWDALCFRYETDKDPDAVKVLLADLRPDVRDLLVSGEVLLQKWRWDGRPLGIKDGFPYDGDPDSLANLDALLFGTRDSDDALVVPLRWDSANRPEEQLLYRHPIGNPGAHYFRGAVRARSRYAGLLPDPTPIDSRDGDKVERQLRTVRTLGASRDNGGARELWRRQVVKCRWKQAVDPPRVRMVLPLTGAQAEDSSVPGMLVVIDGDWFDERRGGLAEVLEARVVSVARPDDPTVLRPEFGPDPIVSVEPIALDSDAARLSPVGPIGYTFDTDMPAPWFRHSAFVIPPPAVKPPHVASFSMAKLQFRRAFDGKGVIDSDGKRASAWSAGVWCQFLPPADAFLLASGKVKPVSESAFKRTADGWKLEIAGSPPLPSPSARDLFSLYAAITRPVTDVFGRGSHERWDSFAPIAEDGSFPAGAGDLFVRIVEVQRRAGAQPAPHLLDELFPPDDGATGASGQPPKPSEARARIVRVSSRLTVVDRRYPHR